jgi:RNA polymerase sigma-70 factor (ECF subfamily)
MPNSSFNAHTTDEELMEQFKGGNEAAFVELYTRYKRRVYAYCVKMVTSKERAEDVYQEIFVRVARKRDHFKGGNFASWLFAISRNLCLNALRDKTDYYSLEDVSETLKTPASSVEYDESAELLRRAIDQLTPDLREALILRVYDGLSYNEIAEVTDTKLATVKVRIHRAKQKLYELLTPYFADKV